MFCENCGTKIIDGYKFCEKCGQKVINKKQPEKQIGVVNDQEEDNNILVVAMLIFLGFLVLLGLSIIFKNL